MLLSEHFERRSDLLIFVLCVRLHYSPLVSTRNRRVLTKATIFVFMFCARFNASTFWSGTIIMGELLLIRDRSDLPI